jgi:hypothetical protein
MGGFITLVLLAVYGGGAWKFWNGFRRTNFNTAFTNKLRLALLWPFLLAYSKSYRQNFRKALKG